jgi:site-specific DNA-methyltransferase (adenine-specific)
MVLRSEVVNDWHPGIPEEFRNRVVCGETLDLILRLPDNSVDAIITDPPYSSGGLFRADRQGDTRAKYVVDGTFKSYQPFSGDNRDQRSYSYWCSLWLSQCLRVTKPGGILCMFTDWRQLPSSSDAIQCGGWIWRGIVPWDKTEAARPDKGRFRNQCEYVLWASKGQIVERDDAPCLPGVVRLYGKPDEKVHIAGKPVGLIRQLLKIVPPGGTVLDPFTGGGSTPMACVEEGYPFIGFEIGDQWVSVANERVRTSGTTLFNALTASDSGVQLALLGE